MGYHPDQHFEFMQYNVETGKKSIDSGLDGDIVAEVHQDTEEFGEWTPTARLIRSAPVLLATLQEIADGKLPYHPRVLAQAALAYIERTE
jgi:hypothetical protein